MLKNSVFKTIPFIFFIVLFNSCDKEFSVVGEDIVGDNSFNIVKEEFPVVAYNQKIEPIQSNNLDINALGVYDNPSFGTTTATFVTQLTMASVNPTFDLTTAKIKSVVLSIPYFSHKDPDATVDSEGKTVYVLDSIYGSAKAKMKLSVHESGYFLRNLDPVDQLTQPQKYYNDQYSDFTQNIIGNALNDDSDTTQNSAFFFDPSQHPVKTTTDGKDVTTWTPPAMQLNLNKAFFTAKILNAPAGSLVDNNVFVNYFRGLFFNIEADSGELAMINFKGGKITITYTETVSAVETEKTFVLNLTGNTVSLLNQSNANADYVSATNPANINKVQGDSNLYLKGGEGSLSVLKLFNPADNHGKELSDGPNGVSDQLDDLRRNKSLINQANLTFHLNTAAMGKSEVPQRIYLYDFKNNKVLADYSDLTTSSNHKNDRFVFGGIITKETAANGGGYTYKFRITEHVRNLVKRDSTNIDLGLVVTENINKSNFYTVRDKTKFPSKVPMASVMNPLGTIVFGNNIPSNNENYSKRVKFEIYYTKTN
ncbi:DUF4270 domain-containing protein [Flavobacterium marginilacus]|uniref:DUF4270 domain-containing protein n=1 Tax=Flavobacterium marginilacus TaxID=3003256 RepID=UPI00248EDFEB|nr:DUF4270 domain-containing protein [Flavobacterium marginilacus]